METTHPYFYLCVLYVHMCVYSSASGRIIGAKDYASIQINIADVSVKKKKKKKMGKCFLVSVCTETSLLDKFVLLYYI